ncbi:hypothetical protein ES708_21324 [subsurface metagenome]
MLRAYCEKLKEFYNTSDGLPENPKNFDWRCPACKERLMHVNKSYNNRIEHFRHFSKNKCYNYEPETKEHLLMKDYCYRALLNNNPVKRQLEYIIGDQIIDVFFELETGEKIAIECQCSSISVEKLLERTKKYEEKGFYTLWILGSEGSITGKYKSNVYYPRKSDGKVKKVTAVEKALHEIYGRVYYFDTTGYISPYSWHIYSLGFSDYKGENYRILKNSKWVKKLDDFTSKIICMDYTHLIYIYL